MAALSSDIQGGRKGTAPNPERVSVEVENSEVVYKGAFLQISDKGNATSANQGRLGAYTGEAGSVFAGYYDGIKEPAIPGDYASAPSDSVTGDTSGSPIPKAGAEIQGRVFKEQTVTGAASVADQWAPVYLADDNTFTLTPQTRPEAVGVVTQYLAADSADVYVFGIGEHMGGIRPMRIPVSQRNITATGTSGNLVTGFPMPCKGILLAVGYEVGTELTGSPDTVINAELGGTDVTGGTVALAAAAVGVYNVGTSFATAGQYFSRGALLDLEISGSTGASAGAVYLFVDVLVLSGS